MAMDQISNESTGSIAEGSIRNSIKESLRVMGVESEATIDKVIAKGKNSLEAGLTLLKQDLEQNNANLFQRNIHNIKGILLNLGLKNLAANIKKMEEHVKVSQLDLQAKADFDDLEGELVRLISQL